MAMHKNDTAFLKNTPLFTGLTDAKLAKLIEIIDERTVNAGAVITRDGEIGNEMFILLDGEVEVSKSLLLKVSGQGMDQRDKSLNRLTADEHAFFGEMALFGPACERTATVTAKSRCTIAVLSREKFFRLTETDNEIGYRVLMNIVAILSDRLDKTTKDVLKLTTALSLALER